MAVNVQKSHQMSARSLRVCVSISADI